MANQYVDLETLKFLLYKVNNLQDVLDQERYAEYDQESVEMMLNSVKDFSDKELYPFFREMDEQPAHFKDGEIVVHPQVLKFMKAGGEMGLIASSFSYEHGGMQMPAMAAHASAFIQDAANNHLPGYIGLTVGSAELIAHFGSQELKDTYLPNMLSGKWGGTMCLTEPQAGSSLSDITTSATPDGDTYKIHGQKIFISGGDYQGADNIVHLVLARIKGAPAGTKGISLFVVPKKKPTADGSLTSNDVTVVADFEKMGQRGYCTTHLFFGDKENCEGWLVGEANKGLKYMFLMMNGARIGVGRGAAAIASAAYQASLNYANERPQGRKLTSTGKKDVNQEQTLIINHADVRRMLLLQKVITEGAQSLVLLTAKYHDLSIASATAEEREKYRLLLEIMTPLVKTYPSEAGIVSVNNGVQVLGGYGFCSEYILQQLELRQQVLQSLMGFAMKGDYQRFLADATPFMEFFSTIVQSWLWLNIGLEAQNALVMGNKDYSSEFYESKIHAMEFYFKYELPKTLGLAEILMDNEKALTIGTDKEVFI